MEGRSTIGRTTVDARGTVIGRTTVDARGTVDGQRKSVGGRSTIGGRPSHKDEEK